MIIANPMYDVIFKYLLEDTEIARELLSVILSEQIVKLSLQPQETATEMPANNLNILRFDFKAVIRTQTNEHKKVLIELQKAKHLSDATRFRRYLGDNYRKEDELTNEDNVPEKRPIPIVTVYFLGFTLRNMPRPVVKINREYIDVLTQEVLEVKEDFVELLTHDSYFIQIKLLESRSQSKLAQVLQVFNPQYETADKHQLDFAGDINDPLVKRMVDRLSRAVASEELRNLMEVEDEIDRELRKRDDLLLQKDRELAAKETELLAERERAAAERERAETERERAAAERERAAAEHERAETERKRAETERERAEQLMKELEELKKQLKK